MLRNGESVPSFSLPATDGTVIHANNLLGKISVVIFLRGHFCPTSDRFLSAYQDILPRFTNLGVQLLAVNSDDKERNAKTTAELRLNFPLLSDQSCGVAQMFGMYVDNRRNGRLFVEPGLVVIDREGRVAYSVISSGPKGLPSPGDLLPVLLYMFFHDGKY